MSYKKDKIRKEEKTTKKEFNKNVCKKIFDDIIPERFSSLKDEEKFTIISMLSILNNKNILESIDIINDEIIIDGTGDFGNDAIAIYINSKFIGSEDDIQSLLDIKPWDINIIINQSKFNSSWPTDMLNNFNAYLPMFFEGNLKSNNSDLMHKQNIIKIILSKMPVNSSINIELNLCNIGDKDDIKDDKTFNQAKQSLLTNLANLAWLNKNNIIINEIDLEFIKNNIFLKPFTKNIQFLKNFVDTFSGKENDGYVLLTTLYHYYNFITQHNEINESIFENNVRDFQNSTDINQNISKTVISEKELDFWWLNNGITIIAEEIGDPIGDNIQLVNPQIINGLQTSYSLYNSIRKELNEDIDYLKKMELNDKRKVLIKIIKTRDIEKSEKIIKASNTQNSMNSATQMANNPILRSLEVDFKIKGLFFERRKRFYSNRKEYDKNKIITPDYTAKYYVATIKNSPAIAKNRTIIFFRDLEYFNKIFSKDNKLLLINITYLAWNINNLLIDLEINNTSFSKDQIKYIKIHFKYHLISLYFKKYGEKNEVDINKLNWVTSKFFEILDSYIKQDFERINDLRKISTSIEFQKFMYDNFK